MKLLLVREKWSHMSDVSGFDPLFKAIEQNSTVHCTSILINEVVAEPVNAYKQPGIIVRAIKWLWRKISKTQNKVSNSNQSQWAPIHLTPGVQPVHELAFKKIRKLDEIEQFDYILFSVAEDQLGYGLYYSSQSFKSRCVLFFHQPPSWLKLHWSDFAILNQFRLIVSLSTEHFQFIKSRTSVAQLKIRHGVDLNFFEPPEKVNIHNIPEVLFVGNWYRDFEVLEKVTTQLNAQGIKFNLHCVVPRKDRNQAWITKLAINPNVAFYADLTPEELKGLYQRADVFFLPLLDSTANNALIEAMASGLFMVTTKVGGVIDYVNEDFCLLANRGDVDDHLNKLKLALASLSSIKLKSADIRKHAEEHLDWSKIANEVLSDLKVK
jgi:glycosyltransferase involved in cell wall biosynthesis